MSAVKANRKRVEKAQTLRATLAGATVQLAEQTQELEERNKELEEQRVMLEEQRQKLEEKRGPVPEVELTDEERMRQWEELEGSRCAFEAVRIRSAYPQNWPAVLLDKAPAIEPLTQRRYSEIEFEQQFLTRIEHQLKLEFIPALKKALKSPTGQDFGSGELQEDYSGKDVYRSHPCEVESWQDWKRDARHFFW